VPISRKREDKEVKMALKYACPQCAHGVISTSLQVGDVTVCPFCSQKVAIPASAVETDERPDYTTRSEAGPESSDPAAGERRFPALRTIASIVRFFAWLLLISGIIVFFVLISAKQTDFFGQAAKANVPLAFTCLLVGVGGFVLVLALAELIGVFLGIEENTRATRELLSRQP
jgi:DNA-directed RNA polymerase subunit RPC12/RpoP